MGNKLTWDLPETAVKRNHSWRPRLLDGCSCWIESFNFQYIREIHGLYYNQDNPLTGNLARVNTLIYTDSMAETLKK